MADGAITRHEFECELQRLRDIMDERDRRYAESYKAAEDSVDVSVKALSEYKAQQNEWRGSLADMGGRKLDRSDYDVRHREIERQMDELRKSLAELRESRAGWSGTLVVLSAIISIIAAGVVAWLVSRFDGR